MLKLNSKLTKEQKSIRLGKIREKFATYFGFVASGSISEALALNQAINNQRATEPLGVAQPSARSALVPDNRAIQIFNIFLDGGSGALKAIRDQRPDPISNELKDQSIKGKIKNLFTGADHQAIQNFSNYVNMHYCNNVSGNEDANEVFIPNLDRIGFDSANSLEQSARSKLSAFRMIHPLLAPGEKNADLLTIFFNAFPTLELARSTPVLDIKLYSSRQVFQDGRLAAISLQKSLEGAVDAPEGTNQNSALRAIGLANQVTASAFGDSFQDFQNYSIVGMELFRAPQTLVNPDAARIKNNFLAPIIDPFRPLASIKSLDIDVRSAVGLISTKTAKLEIVLHDRSRMGEFADIIKPDRYGSSFVDVEYGWSHPDQTPENPNEDGNPYADILNLTRLKEHYNITNSSFSFDDVGQVNITLNLVTRGVSEMTELSITGNQEHLRQQLSFIENISKTINRLSGIAFGNENNNSDGQNTHRSEIRGHQMLGAAGDATNMLVINADLLGSLRQLRAALDARITATRGNTPSSQRVINASSELRTQLNRLVGPGTSDSVQSIDGGSAIGAIQTTINQDIANSLKNINNTDPATSDFNADIFFLTMESVQKDHFSSRDAITRRERPNNSRNSAAVTQENNQLLDSAELNNILTTHRRKTMSLGTLFMAFVAKPLAMIQDKFEEVQVYFYNFNNKASRMSHCNISQFPVVIDFFAREYSRMRLENLNRSVNMSVVDFVNFLANKIVDDPMNSAYGINDLYKYSRDGQQLEINTDNGQIGTGERTKQDNFNRLMRTRMEANNIGHSPDFQMPQITLDIEAVPYAYDDKKTILKLHVYDKACSTTAPLRELLSLSTENLMSSLSTFPANAQAAAAEEESVALIASQSESRHHRSNRGNNRGNNRTAEQSTVSEHPLRDHWRQCYGVVVNHADRLRLITPVQQAPPNPTERPQITPAQRTTQYRFSGGPKRLKEMVMQYVPHIIYGCMGTTVKTANLSTQQNAQLASINMLRSLNGDPVSANGEQAGGVPLSVYPCELSITTLGCPFIRYSQELFVDFNTNTTADNIYYVTGLSHKIEAGNYETTIKLTPNDAFGQYRNLISQLNSAGNYLHDINTHGVSEPVNTTSENSSTNNRTQRRS